MLGKESKENRQTDPTKISKTYDVEISGRKVVLDVSYIIGDRPSYQYHVDGDLNGTYIPAGISGFRIINKGEQEEDILLNLQENVTDHMFNPRSEPSVSTSG